MLVGARRLSIEIRNELDELEGVSRRSDDGMLALLAFAARRGLGAADICGLGTGLAWWLKMPSRPMLLGVEYGAFNHCLRKVS